MMNRAIRRALAYANRKRGQLQSPQAAAPVPVRPSQPPITRQKDLPPDPTRSKHTQERKRFQDGGQIKDALDLAQRKLTNKAPYGVIDMGDKIILGAPHGQPIELSDELKQRVQEVAGKHGAWYEGDAKDTEAHKNLISNPKTYRGSWDDAVAQSVKGYPVEYLAPLFSNVEVNKQHEMFENPQQTIFDSLLANQHKARYFKDRDYDKDTLTNFLKQGSEKDADFMRMAASPATKENLQKFFSTGEKLMWPDNWQEYPNKLGQIAKRFEESRNKFLRDAGPGVYIAGAGHIPELKNTYKDLNVIGGERAGYDKGGSIMFQKEEQPRKDIPLRPYEQRFNPKSGKLDAAERKDIGFYGPIKNPMTDHEITEYSSDRDFQYPTVYEGMSDKDRAAIMMAERLGRNAPKGALADVDDRAYAQAQKRKAQGRSPFYEPGKDPYPKWSPEQHWDEPYGMPKDESLYYAHGGTVDGHNPMSKDNLNKALDVALSATHPKRLHHTLARTGYAEGGIPDIQGPAELAGETPYTHGKTLASQFDVAKVQPYKAVKIAPGPVDVKLPKKSMVRAPRADIGKMRMHKPKMKKFKGLQFAKGGAAIEDALNLASRTMADMAKGIGRENGLHGASMQQGATSTIVKEKLPGKKSEVVYEHHAKTPVERQAFASGGSSVSYQPKAQDSTNNFVLTAYEEMLGRKPSKPELTAWVNYLDQGGTDKGGLMSTLAQSVEGANWANTKAVDQTFWNMAGRQATQADYNTYLPQLAAGTLDYTGLRNAISKDPDAQNYQNTQLLNDTAYALLGRPATQKEQNDYLPRLADGTLDSDKLFNEISQRPDSLAYQKDEKAIAPKVSIAPPDSSSFGYDQFKSYLGDSLKAAGDDLYSKLDAINKAIQMPLSAGEQAGLDLISKLESGGNYNMILGDDITKDPASGRIAKSIGYTGNLDQIPLNELYKMQGDMLRSPANNKNSSAVGKLQFTRENLFGTEKAGFKDGQLYKFGITPDMWNRFSLTPALQDKLGAQMAIEKRGMDLTNPNTWGQNAKNEWASMWDTLRNKEGINAVKAAAEGPAPTVGGKLLPGSGTTPGGTTPGSGSPVTPIAPKDQSGAIDTIYNKSYGRNASDAEKSYLNNAIAKGNLTLDNLAAYLPTTAEAKQYANTSLDKIYNQNYGRNASDAEKAYLNKAIGEGTLTRENLAAYLPTTQEAKDFAAKSAKSAQTSTPSVTSLANLPKNSTVFIQGNPYYITTPEEAKTMKANGTLPKNVMYYSGLQSLGMNNLIATGSNDFGGTHYVAYTPQTAAQYGLTYSANPTTAPGQTGFTPSAQVGQQPNIGQQLAGSGAGGNVGSGAAGTIGGGATSPTYTGTTPTYSGGSAPTGYTYTPVSAADLTSGSGSQAYIPPGNTYTGGTGSLPIGTGTGSTTPTYQLIRPSTDLGSAVTRDPMAGLPSSSSGLPMYTGPSQSASILPSGSGSSGAGSSTYYGTGGVGSGGGGYSSGGSGTWGGSTGGSGLGVITIERNAGGRIGASKEALRIADHYANGGGAWTRKEGKNPKGGLNAKGRASLRAQGHDIRPPAPHPKTEKDAARRKSFCARMSGMPGPMKDDNGKPTRKALSLRAWNCRADGGMIDDALRLARSKVKE